MKILTYVNKWISFLPDTFWHQNVNFRFIIHILFQEAQLK